VSLIFNKFPSRKAAELFVTAIQKDFGLDGQVFDDEESAFEHDMFPFRLKPPIVHIDRIDFDRPGHLEIQDQVIERVTDFRGEFAGT
jgi:hypothetical protein